METCRLCDRPVKARRLCGMHYRRWWRHGDPRKAKETKRTYEFEVRFCTVEGCGRAVTGRGARGLCNMHYGRLRRTGSTDDPVRLPPIRQCEIPGCRRVERVRRGMCVKHYFRWRNHGDPMRDTPPGGQRTDPRCQIPGCSRKHLARGFCGAHWMSWKTYGDPLGSGKPSGKAKPETVERYAALTPAIREALRSAMTAYAIGDYATARKFADVAENVGRPLTKLEREVVAAIRETRDQREAKERARVIELAKAGYTVAEIARITGLKERQIRYRLTQAKFGAERDAKIVEYALQGYTVPEIVRLVGGDVNRHIVWGVIRRRGIKVPDATGPLRPDAIIGKPNSGTE